MFERGTGTEGSGSTQWDGVICFRGRNGWCIIIIHSHHIVCHFIQIYRLTPRSLPQRFGFGWFFFRYYCSWYWWWSSSSRFLIVVRWRRWGGDVGWLAGNNRTIGRSTGRRVARRFFFYFLLLWWWWMLWHFIFVFGTDARFASAHDDDVLFCRSDDLIIL